MDWEIGTKAVGCAACEAAFAEEQDLFSAIYDEPTGFTRRDYCLGCWESQDRAGSFSHWQTRVPKKNGPMRRFVDDEVALDFFRRLEGEQELGKVNFRYVLGLLLMRRKALKFTEFKRTEVGAVLVLHDRARACNYEVLDPNLTEEQIQQVTQEINQLLNVQA